MENKDIEFTPECDKEMELYFPKNDIYEPSIITIEEGISAHIDHDRESAWRCFNYHADLGNMLAKYWKGYYLWEGIPKVTSKNIKANITKNIKVNMTKNVRANTTKTKIKKTLRLRQVRILL